MRNEGNTATAASHRPVTAVVPAAGLGTRIRPLSDVVPKEMLPVGRLPVLERIVSELEAAGIRHVALVLSPAKESIRSYFGGRRGSVEFSYVVQPEMLGLGDAVLRAEDVAGESFVIALGDAVFEEPTVGGVTRRLIDAVASRGATVGLAVQRVVPENISRYGVVRPSSAGSTDTADVVPISDIVEKPSAREAPSDLAAAARYVVTRDVFAALRETPPDARGEIQLTHALQRLLRQGRAGVAVPLRSAERRHDIGAFDSYFRAFLAFALADPEFGGRLRRDASDILANSGHGQEGGEGR